MSWAARRRFIILFGIGAIALAFLTVVLIATFTKTPTCTDGAQNQGEEGIDCGGPCAYLCTAQMQPPKVLFTRALDNGTERTDIIASVENKNAAAAKDVPYRVRIHGAKGLIQEVSGTIDLPPGATVPVFISGVFSGKRAVTNAFLTIDPTVPRWFSPNADSRTVPLVSNLKQSGTQDTPRIEATLTNSDATVLMNVRAIVLVRNVGADVIAASETIVPTIPAQGTATAIFTWNNAFSSTPASIEVVPIIPLSDWQTKLP
jgi:hypothetical protein